MAIYIPYIVLKRKHFGIYFILCISAIPISMFVPLPFRLLVAVPRRSCVVKGSWEGMTRMWGLRPISWITEWSDVYNSGVASRVFFDGLGIAGKHLEISLLKNTQRNGRGIKGQYTINGNGKTMEIKFIRVLDKPNWIQLICGINNIVKCVILNAVHTRQITVVSLL